MCRVRHTELIWAETSSQDQQIVEMRSQVTNLLLQLLSFTAKLHGAAALWAKIKVCKWKEKKSLGVKRMTPSSDADFVRVG